MANRRVCSYLHNSVLCFRYSSHARVCTHFSRPFNPLRFCLSFTFMRKQCQFLNKSYRTINTLLLIRLSVLYSCITSILFLSLVEYRAQWSSETKSPCWNQVMDDFLSRDINIFLWNWQNCFKFQGKIGSMHANMDLRVTKIYSGLKNPQIAI